MSVSLVVHVGPPRVVRRRPGYEKQGELTPRALDSGLMPSFRMSLSLVVHVGPLRVVRRRPGYEKQGELTPRALDSGLMPSFRMSLSLAFAFRWSAGRGLAAFSPYPPVLETLCGSFVGRSCRVLRRRHHLFRSCTKQRGVRGHR